MWFRLMFIAFVANGISPFGLKVLAARNVASQFTYPYLALWYLGGAAFALMVFVSRHWKPYGREVLIAGGMSFCSIGIQLSLARALEENIPGHIVFPVITGSNLFIVAAAGVILFKERIGRYGIAGMILGTASLVILSVS